AVDAVGVEVTVDVAQRAADVPHELGEVVLADVHDVEHAGLALEELPHHRPADRPRPADDEEPPRRHRRVERSAVPGQVLREQRLLPPDDPEHPLQKRPPAPPGTPEAPEAPEAPETPETPETSGSPRQPCKSPGAPRSRMFLAPP